MADEIAPLPSLEHGIAPPEEFLPPTPWWVWSVIILAALFVFFAVIWVRKSIHPPLEDKSPPLPDYYRTARKRLKNLQSQLANQPVSEIAAEASLAVRSFLSGALAEPALFETTEEFTQREVFLPKDAADLLSDLNHSKYSPSFISPELSEQLVNRSLACLKTLHTANTFVK
ncbi:hypothetical protein N9A94_07535 [Akkermansiaceae bacterium]|nr:hypothetical protein [Akkermansiaceae bacterium]